MISSEIWTRLLGKDVARKLGLYHAKLVSRDNIVVNSYLESVDGAIRDGQLISGSTGYIETNGDGYNDTREEADKRSTR